MNQSDIDKLLELRSAWDKFKSKAKAEKSSQDYDDYYKVVWKHGVETQHDIEEFNHLMIVALFREFRTVHGECDQCKGYEGQKPCITWHGDNACIVTRKVFIMDPESCYEDFYNGIVKALTPSIATTADHFDSKGDSPPPFHVTKNWWDDSTKKQTISGNRLYVVCPPGHGYYQDYIIPAAELHKLYFSPFWIP
jgi:hypothetical protein